MRYIQSLAIALPLTAVMIFAQDPSQRPSSSQSTESSSQKSKSRSSSQTQETGSPAQVDRSTSRTERTTQSEHSSSRTERKTGQADVAGGQTIMGTIVDANCSQASSLMGSSTASSSTSTTTAGETKSTDTKSHASAKKDVLRHCQPTASTTSFAVITDDGNFYKLDETGNSKVTSDLGGAKKNMKVTVNGSLEGDTLKVQSLSKR